MSDFGMFVKEMRTKKGMSLREFCRLANLDPGNWSKVERGKFPPPRSRKVVSDIASVLLIERGSRDWSRLFDLAALGHIPAGLLAEPAAGDRINVFFRLAHSDAKLSQAEWDRALRAFRSGKEKGK
jgi:transcriptional regulator with XRE-family HTH domain